MTDTNFNLKHPYSTLRRAFGKAPRDVSLTCLPCHGRTGRCLHINPNNQNNDARDTSCFRTERSRHTVVFNKLTSVVTIPERLEDWLIRVGVVITNKFLQVLSCLGRVVWRVTRQRGQQPRE